MTNNTKLLIAVIILIAVGGLAYYYSGEKPVEETPGVTQTESVLGCYVATLSKDVYSMKVSAQDGKKVNGTLVFDNFEKDSSHGTFSGTYENGILLAEYSFASEGMDSKMQVIFKKVGNDFVRGYGPLNEDGTTFSDMSQIQYDTNQTFKASPTCVTTLQ